MMPRLDCFVFSRLLLLALSHNSTAAADSTVWPCAEGATGDAADNNCYSAAQAVTADLNSCLSGTSKDKAACLVKPLNTGIAGHSVSLIKADGATLPVDFFGREYAQPLSAVCMKLAASLTDADGKKPYTTSQVSLLPGAY